MRESLSVFRIAILLSMSAWLFESASAEDQAVSPAAVISGAVGPFAAYCDGYGNNGASGNGYVSVLTLGFGIVKNDMDPGLQGIVAFDRAETNGTYIGQINMMTALAC